VSGTSRILHTAYDQITVPGVTNPNINSRPIYMVDPLTIALYEHAEAPGNSGIKLQWIDYDTSTGAALSYYRLAPSNADGTEGTYLATGLPLNISAIRNKSTLSAPVVPSNTSITVADGSLFAGMGMIFLLLDNGTVNEEIVAVTNRVGNVLTITPATNPHAGGVTVYHCGTKIWSKITLPGGISGGVPTNLYDVVFRIIFESTSRAA
jgi:hypothetical protein